MAVDLSWSDPTAAQGSAGLALVTGDTLTQTSWQKTVSNIYVLGGGNQEAGMLQYVSATQVRFRAVNGAWVRIAGLLYNLTADITATNTNASIDGTAGSTLANSTLYYVYLFISGSTVTIDFSTTAYAISSTSGNYGTYIKSGANTRTLIGMIRTNGSGEFVDSATQRFVRSWFNDPGIAGTSSLSANRTTTETSYAEINSEIRVEFLAWTGEVVTISATGTMENSTAGQSVNASIGIDDTTAEDMFNRFNNGATGGTPGSFGGTINKTGLTEGYHYATLLGYVNANTGTFYGNAAAGLRCALTVRARR